MDPWTALLPAITGLVGVALGECLAKRRQKRQWRKDYHDRELGLVRDVLDTLAFKIYHTVPEFLFPEAFSNEEWQKARKQVFERRWPDAIDKIAHIRFTLEDKELFNLLTELIVLCMAPDRELVLSAMKAESLLRRAYKRLEKLST